MAYYVDRVVVADAFEEPGHHYKILADGRSKLVEGRRPSMTVKDAGRDLRRVRAAAADGVQRTLIDELLYEEEENEFINSLRDEVRQWREAGYPDTARVTGRLLEWWFERPEERHVQQKRFFFCQQEAVETVIYLYEVKRRQKMPETEDLLRYALKLATGTGKTVVMALLIVWSTLHKAKVSGSTLSANFLVLVPNLTVRQRVSGEPRGDGLDPGGAENLYEAFDMVPPDYTETFRPNIQVRNWQSVPLETQRDDWVADSMFGEDRFIPASLLWAKRRRERRDPNAGIRKLLKGWRDCVVINDEAHHVYGQKRTRRDEDPAYIVWSRIIHRIDAIADISLVVDLSATPWYGSGSAKPEGQLFQWVVSDFSVYDAFESGLVKVVRLPEPGSEGAQYIYLWDDVKDAKTKEEYLTACRGAIATLYASWLADWEDWSQKFETFRDPMPVMLVVADQAKKAKWLREHLTKDFRHLRNDDPDDVSSWVTIQVDSGVFDADKGKEARLREMVSTVGRKGKPGEAVRCIVSVNMLSEGWDVQSVTHIIGLRAFGSPLLTEQIIGRGLRRTDYTVLYEPIEDRGPGSDETVDAFGVPFVGFPVQKTRKRSRKSRKGGTPIPIEPLKSRGKHRMRIPNVRSWGVGVSEPLSTLIDVASLPGVTIDPRKTPDEVKVKPVVGGRPEAVMTLEKFREDNPMLGIKLALAAELLERTNPDDAEIPGVGPTFEELLEVVNAYLSSRLEVLEGGDERDVWIPMYQIGALDVLDTAIRGVGSGALKPIPIPSDPPHYDTAELKTFRWVGHRADGKKTHLSKVACDSPLEVDFADFLDAADDVASYVKNEKIGFSVTYFEGGRPRQYFPDFVIALDGVAGPFVIAETKGEIFPNTHLKSEAARLWCERMSAAGSEGEWSYVFVHEPVFRKAQRSGVRTLADLTALIEGVPRRRHLEFVPVDDDRVEADAFESLLPVYSLEAAAGYFGSGREVELEGWVEVAGLGRLDERMFVAQAVGRSMEPLIEDGSWCVFRAYPTGSRNGKVVLAQYSGLADPDTGASFTVKRYRSEKQRDGDSWHHVKVVLEPENKNHDPIVITDEDEGAIAVIAEYLGSLEQMGA